MPLPTSLRLRDWPGQSSAPDGTMGGVEVITIPVIHELGFDLKAGMIESTRWLPPSKRPVIVRVESQVVTPAMEGVHSPEYVAAVRRRKCRGLADTVATLTAHAAREDFVVCTYPLLNLVNDLLKFLSGATTEGNTREILRQLRNTLMNGGWKNYRDPKVRQVAGEILNGLAQADEVLPEHVRDAFDALYAAGADPVGTRVLPVDDDETLDGKNEILG